MELVKGMKFEVKHYSNIYNYTNKTKIEVLKINKKTVKYICNENPWLIFTKDKEEFIKEFKKFF